MPRPEVQILANLDGWIFQTILCIHCWQPRLLIMWSHAFWAVQHPATFQWLMQNCLRELNLIYCLIYLDGIVVFSHTTEEHLHKLCVVFDQFKEDNLNMNPSKCNFFKEEITYLGHWVSKEGVWPSNSNLKTITECTLPQTYTEVHAFLGLVGHYRRFIKGFTQIAWPLNDHLTREGASRKSEQVSLSEDALKAFEELKQACMTAPMLAFVDSTKPFLLEMDASKMGSGQCCPRNRWTEDITQLTMAAEPLCLMRRTTIWLSLSFWHWCGKLKNISKSTCPINLSW